MAVAMRTSQNVRKQYFQTKQPRKTQNVWCNVVRRSRCNAFAIARFLVYCWQGAWRHVICICGCHAELPKTQYFRTKENRKMLIICQIDWREVGVAFKLQCLHKCTLSSFTTWQPTFVQGQRVKGHGHSVCNRQHRLTAKSVVLSYLFNLSGGRGHEVHETSKNTIFWNQKNEKPRKSS